MPVSDFVFLAIGLAGLLGGWVARRVLVDGFGPVGPLEAIAFAGVFGSVILVVGFVTRLLWGWPGTIGNDWGGLL